LYVSISERQVEVGNMFSRYIVPRWSLVGFEAGPVGLDLVVRERAPIPCKRRNCR
jgi:hypothetical protein